MGWNVEAEFTLLRDKTEVNVIRYNENLQIKYGWIADVQFKSHGFKNEDASIRFIQYDIDGEGGLSHVISFFNKNGVLIHSNSIYSIHDNVNDKIQVPRDATMVRFHMGVSVPTDKMKCIVYCYFPRPDVMDQDTAISNVNIIDSFTNVNFIKNYTI
ncbi:hypothetical protein ECIV_ORF8 [European chub iridovirus]|nr:hypothetical protein ECIV_ORF8 [European chub iridovirus]